ncbi:MAG: molybdate ABC transporter substrate-binding protein [Deltaproteobacteria bacterium]|jgi:molybdate transport system substrate-binding protein|nr:molybdate ABC transporter substrate-binding protein [Deltaproteobacteria bacterium]
MCKKTRIFLSVFVLILLSCLSATVWAAEITVSAAASLTNAFTEVRAAFEKDNPGIVALTNFASSNALLAQIESGAPVDVFASADQATMNRAEEKKLVFRPSRKNFAGNGLVLIVPAAGGLNPSGAGDLTGVEYDRIAVGNPDSVPAGRYAREVLEGRNIWSALAPKLVYGESVRQVLDYVVRDEVRAGFVYSTDARQAGAQVRVVETLKGKTPVLYPIAVLEASKNKAEAQKFVDFVLSPAGQDILSRYGFSAP